MRLKVLLVLFALLFIIPSRASFASRGLPEIFESIELEGPRSGAVGELERYIDANPGDTSLDEAVLRLARVHAQRKDYGKAVELYQKVLERFPLTRYKYEVLYELGYTRYVSGNAREARSALEAVAVGQGAALELRAKASRLIREIESASAGFGEASVPAIGVLLPLKGSYEKFAQDALAGVLLAAEVFGAKGAPGFEVIVKDVGADPASVEGAVTELAGNPRVAGIVGPLLSSTAAEAVKHAQRKRVPIITLSQKEGVTEAGDFVFRNFVTPSAQAASMAEFAGAGLGVKRFAVLYPQNNYGVELSKNFEIEVKRHGGAVVRSAFYKAGQTDFSDEIKRLFGIQAKQRKEGRRVITEYNPTVEVDAIFIPDSYESVALIVPYLEYYNVKGVRLLGSSGWNSDKLVELAGKGVEGAFFVDAFFVESQRPGTGEFISLFSEVYGRSPGLLEAHAYDAARMLILAARGSSEFPEREPVRDRLKSMKGVRGAAGAISFDARGEAQKKLFILTVKDGRIVEAAF